MRKVTLITTGGTIEKTYDERTGELENRRSIVHRMLEELRLDDREISVLELMSKDSLDMTEEDREQIVEAVRLAGAEGGEDTSSIVILHGTDTLQLTGERLEEAFSSPAIPIVLTGAWRPYEMKRSDALQNLTESLFAAANLPPGVYCVAHGRALAFPGVIKDPERSTFVRRQDR